MYTSLDLVLEYAIVELIHHVVGVIHELLDTSEGAGNGRSAAFQLRGKRGFICLIRNLLS